ncbi:MAG TPA: biotin--[acetyl-CoA-carboxylase] ligase [Gammaproteobacteria bacterium]|nr:biotin--[acetyl-CoA-carboxylase] ligase [Gammaproteobacteria bacterium]
MIKEPLDCQQIHRMFSPESLVNLSKIEIFDTIDSTNTWLLKQAKAGAASGHVCLAEQQTQGRGRLGRSWYSPRGTNIYCSLLWRFSPDQDVSGLGIAVGVMVVNALSQYGIRLRLQLKWPNDVLARSRKLSGILLERNESAVVIGIGINLDVKSAEEKNWIDVAELTGRTAERNVLMGLLLNEMLTKLPLFEKNGLNLFLPEWRKYDALLGKNIVINTPRENIPGVMRGVNENGELLLENKAGVLQNFASGEASVIRSHKSQMLDVSDTPNIYPHTTNANTQLDN